jgi:tRNA threonylcarbamoyladenosine biosynthesis protein TsaE
MKLEWVVKSPDELQAVAADLINKSKGQRFFCLHGEMGSGKTTFIKAICKELGVVDEVSSPTFSIVNEYLRGNGDPVYHFDFYRLKKVEEAYDIGYENYFFSDYYCFVEWPEKVESLLNLPKADIFISIELTSRIISCHYE